MARLLHHFEYDNFVRQIEEMRNVDVAGKLSIAPASVVMLLSDLEAGRIDKQRVLYALRFVATFDQTYSKEANTWLSYVNEEFKPSLTEFHKQDFQLKQVGPDYKGNKVSIEFEISRRYTKHNETLGMLLKDLYTLFLAGGGHDINHAEKIELEIFSKLADEQTQKTKILQQTVPASTKFGKIASLERNVIDELYRYYSNEKIADTIYYWCKPRHPMIETLVEKGEPIPIRYESPGVELQFRSQADVYEKFVWGFEKKFRSGNTRIAHAASFFFSVDKRDSDKPDIFVTETDIGKLLKHADPSTGWKYNALVAQELLNVGAEEGLQTTVQFSGSAGFHLLAGIDGDVELKSYKELVEKFGRTDKREGQQPHYAFNTLTSDVLGYIASKRLEKMSKPKIISIDPIKIDKRIDKILVDHSSNKSRGEIRCPTSRHLASGGSCRRIEVREGKLPEEWFDFTNLKRLGNSEEVVREIEEKSWLYTYLPKNSATKFEKFFEKYYDIYALLLWISNKVENPKEIKYTRDDVLHLSEGRIRNILSFWLRR